jgi:hypothetical protein
MTQKEYVEGLLNQYKDRNSSYYTWMDESEIRVRIEQLEQQLTLYLNPAPMKVLLVHDLYETPTYFLDHDEFFFVLDEDMLDDGMSYRVEIKMMTGIQFGQLDIDEV